MPRPARQSASRDLSPGQAAYVLERLVRERRVSQGDVNRYISEMGREISELEAKLQRLRDAHGGMSAAGAASSPAEAPVRRRRGRPPGRPAAATAPAAAGAAPVRRKRRRRAANVTAEQAQSRKLQGKYLSLVRRFPANKRAQYAKVAKDRGREVAIREMQDALK